MASVVKGLVKKVSAYTTIRGREINALVKKIIRIGSDAQGHQ
jgi:hypothetical protein